MGHSNQSSHRVSSAQLSLLGSEARQWLTWGNPRLFWCFCFSKLNKLEQLEELNLSGNKLKTIPTTIANCKRLHTLVAHSNNISIFPEILQLPQIQVFPGLRPYCLWGVLLNCVSAQWKRWCQYGVTASFGASRTCHR